MQYLLTLSFSPPLVNAYDNSLAYRVSDADNAYYLFCHLFYATIGFSLSHSPWRPGLL
jgi:hypothetical protein